MEIHSGNKKVFQHGTVISFKQEPLLFTIDDLKVKISFLDKPEKEQTISPNQIGPKELELTLVNFNNSLGTGTTEALRIGTVSNQNLYLNFVVHALGNQKTVHYTWYLEEVYNGK